MKRHLFKVLAGVSLLLFTSTAAIWVRSYLTMDDVLFPQPGGSHWSFEVRVYPGTLDLVTTRISVPIDEAPFWRTRHALPIQWFAEHYLKFGFGYFPDDFHGQFGARKVHYVGYQGQLCVPFWCAWALTILPPAILLWMTIRKSKRPPAGLCRSCGHDLRATPERCPECGSITVENEPILA